ncbi:MAG: TetR family transcriptional regulator [Rhizomicrobium sp.]
MKRRAWPFWIPRAGLRPATAPAIFRCAGVAAEAGYAPAALYGYFANKDELLLALAADDLSALSRAMREAVASGRAESSPLPPPQRWRYCVTMRHLPRRRARSRRKQAAAMRSVCSTAA